MLLALFRSNRPFAVAVIGDGVGVCIHIRSGVKVVGAGEDGDFSAVIFFNCAGEIHGALKGNGTFSGVNNIPIISSAQCAVFDGCITGSIVQCTTRCRRNRALVDG